MNDYITLSGNFIIINGDVWYQLKKENERLKEEVKKLFEEYENLKLR